MNPCTSRSSPYYYILFKNEICKSSVPTHSRFATGPRARTFRFNFQAHARFVSIGSAMGRDVGGARFSCECKNKKNVQIHPAAAFWHRRPRPRARGENNNKFANSAAAVLAEKSEFFLLKYADIFLLREKCRTRRLKIKCWQTRGISARIEFISTSF